MVDSNSPASSEDQQDIREALKLNLKDARDAVSEKVYKFGATAALSFVKFKQDLGYAEDKEVQEAENYLKDQANTKFPKRIEHVTTQWITDTLHNINSLDKGYEVVDFTEIGIISQNFCSRTVRFSFEIDKIRDTDPENDEEEEHLRPPPKKEKQEIGTLVTPGTSIKGVLVKLSYSYSSHYEHIQQKQSLQLALREILFWKHLANNIPIYSPKLLWSAYNHGTGNYVLLLEDLPSEKNFRHTGKQSYNLESALLLLKKIAAMHARHWLPTLDTDAFKKDDYKILWDVATISEIEHESFLKSWKHLKNRSEEMGPSFYQHVTPKLVQLAEAVAQKGISVFRFQHTPLTLTHSSITPDKILFSQPKPASTEAGDAGEGRKGKGKAESAAEEAEMDLVILDWMTVELGHPLRDVCHVLMHIDEEIFGAQLEGYLHYYYSELVKNNPAVRSFWSLAQCENDFLLALLASVDYLVNCLGEDLNTSNPSEISAAMVMKAQKLSHVLQKITCLPVEDMCAAIAYCNY